MKKIGLFGGSFDPIHKAHIDIALCAIRELELDELRFIPTKNNPWKDCAHSSNEDRIRMIEIAIKDYEKIKIERYEIDSQSDEKNYSYMTLEALTLNSDNKFYFIMGMDQANQFDKWKESQYISEMVQLVAFQRGGYECDENVLNQYHFIILHNEPIVSSSTEIKNGKVELLDSKVLEYITNHGLYIDTMISSYMKEKRWKHSLSVGSLAKEMAKSNGLNEMTAYIAGIFHDVAKEMDYDSSFEIMNKYYQEHINKPIPVWHQWLSAYVSENKFLIKNKEILDAIMWHTTANIPMSKIAKCVYCADKLDPLRDYDSSSEIELCLKNIDEGFKQCLIEFYEYFTKSGFQVDDDFLKIYDYYVIKGEI